MLNEKLADSLPWRYTVIATEPGGSIVELGRFKTNDIATLCQSMLEENLGTAFPQVKFEVDDLHAEHTVTELLTWPEKGD